MLTKQEKKLCDIRVNNLLGFIEACKKIKYDNEQSVRDFYFYCLSCRNRGIYYPLDKFKEWFPIMFHKMQSILNKRTLIKRDLTILKAFSKNVVFGSLTFSDSNISVNEANMRKRAQRYLDQCLSVYEIVEEHGSKNTQMYHVHFLGIMKDNLTYLEFHNGWEDYSYIERVRDQKNDLKKVSKYLCDYVIKQVPKIRRTRRFTMLIKKYQKYEKVLEFDPKESDFLWLDMLKDLCVEEELPF